MNGIGETVTLIKAYRSEDVSKSDEAGIFYQLHPRKALTFKSTNTLEEKI